MDDLVAFLTARLDEDEQTARAAMEPNDEHGGGAAWDVDLSGDGVDGTDGPVFYNDGGIPTSAQAAYIARHDPARVLREVAAKRAILDLLGYDDVLDVVRQMAAVYSGHPDYRAEWKP